MPHTQALSSDVRIHAFRLLPDQDLKASIQAYVDQHGIQAGWIITCVGSLRISNLRYANQPEGTRSSGYREIVSMTGTLSPDGSHIHLCLSDHEGKTTGGHLLDGNIIYTTAEIVIGESPSLRFSREEDKDTGWKELKIRRL
ncbi:MAG: DNA-binding protein [Bacteroidia bacterium]|nr:DNA-binding protein [Bacteroidia bacterium]